jgi:two-component system KDP operon response regulator KdpE
LYLQQQLKEPKVASVLLIDDDAATAQTVRASLVAEGYQVHNAAPGPSALRQTVIEVPDLVMVSMGSGDGEWRFLRRLLTVVECPVLVLVSSGDQVACAQALEFGADDCMAHPLNEIELVARVRVALRRERVRDPLREHSFFVDGELVVDLTRREVRRCDEPVGLTAIEMRLLACLVQHEGEVLSPKQLITQVWGSAGGSSQEGLRQHMCHLRQKLEPEPGRPRRIVTRRGEGYQLRRASPKGPEGLDAIRVEQEAPI